MKKLILILLGTAALAVAQKIVGGPFVVNVTTKTATVVWIVESDRAILQIPGPVKSSPSLRVEKTTLTGLQPNTRHDYRVAGQDAGKGSFKTPPDGGAPYNFVVYG